MSNSAQTITLEPLATVPDVGNFTSGGGGFNMMQCLNKINGWYATSEITIDSDADLTDGSLVPKGLKCYAVEDITASGKYIYYYEANQATDANARRHNGANGAFSGLQPQIRKLVYNAAYATTIKCYFQKG
jgi:hypothetical protein